MGSVSYFGRKHIFNELHKFNESTLQLNNLQSKDLIEILERESKFSNAKTFKFPNVQNAYFFVRINK